MIHLVCTFAPSQLKWVPQLLAHYRSIGVQRFWLTIHLDTDEWPASAVRGAYADASEVLCAHGVGGLPPLFGKFDAELLRQYHDFIQTHYIEAADWVIWADVDEFHIFPRHLHSYLPILEEGQINVISGEMLDRTTHDGCFQVLDPRTPIWTQYPIACNFTARILRGYTHKVVATRGAIRITPGNHEVRRSRSAPAIWAPDVAAIHHFKWDDTVLHRLTPRLREDWKRRCPCWIETERLFDHTFERGCIDLSELLTFDFGEGYHHQKDDAAWDFVIRLRENNPRWREHYGYNRSE